MKPTRPVKCPNCRKSGPWLETSHAPFCSPRCKLIDLGKWLAEENCISEPLRPEHLLNEEEAPPKPPPNREETA